MKDLNSFLIRDGGKCTCKNAERIFDGEYRGKLFFSCSSCHRVSIVDKNNKTLEIKDRLMKKITGRLIKLAKT